MLIVGLDGATWKVIKPNLRFLPTFKMLYNKCKCSTIYVNDSLISASIWCSIFSGKPESEHKHTNFVINGRLQKREDIFVDFIWDILSKEGFDVKVLGVPIIYPPYNFNCTFFHINNGLSQKLNDIQLDLNNITIKSLKILRKNPDLFIVVFNMLDRISHFHWGEKILLDFYKKIDSSLKNILKFDNKFIILSDHGFCDWGKCKNQTLPRRTPKGRIIQGDHHPEAILITNNVKYNIQKPEDIFYAILEEFKNPLCFRSKKRDTSLKTAKYMENIKDQLESLGYII